MQSSMQSSRSRKPVTTIPLRNEYWWDEDLCSRIAAAAYSRAVARGYKPGYKHKDWVAALVEVGC